MNRGTDSFKGNKRYLPSEPCATCGRPMTWRKKWAKTWDHVKYCSDACRGRRSESAVRQKASSLGVSLRLR